MGLIPEFFLDCVVAIGFDNQKNERQYGATGFLYGKFLHTTGDKSAYKIFLVTNKHVFNNHQSAWLRFNPVDDEPAKEFEAALIDENGHQSWFIHPDPEIDLAILSINGDFLDQHNIRFSFFRSDENVITRSQLAEIGICEGDGVFILGFPMGIIGDKRNFVIVKQGIIARIRDTIAGYSKEFLIDASIFPGTSGSPVVLRPEVVSIQGTKPHPQASLLGVVASYLPYRDVAISSQTQQVRVIFEENSGLASIIPIDYLIEIIDSTIVTKEEITQEPPVEIEQVTPEEPQP